MANTAAVCDSYKIDIFNGVHQPGDAYTCALYTDSGNLSKVTTVYTGAGEAIDPNGNYIAGGQVLTGFNVGIDGDTAFATWSTNPVWLNTTLTSVTACLIYNASRGNKAVCIITFPPTSTTNGTFTVVFPTSTGAETITAT